MYSNIGRVSFNAEANRIQLGPNEDRAHRASQQSIKDHADQLVSGNLSPRDFDDMYSPVVPPHLRAKFDRLVYGRPNYNDGLKLIKLLNSATPNLRPGDSSTNSSIQGHFDPGHNPSRNYPNRRSLSPTSGELLNAWADAGQRSSFRHADGAAGNWFKSSSDGPIHRDDVARGIQNPVYPNGSNQGSYTYFNQSSYGGDVTAYEPAGEDHSVYSGHASSESDSEEAPQIPQRDISADGQSYWNHSVCKWLPLPSTPRAAQSTSHDEEETPPASPQYQSYGRAYSPEPEYQPASSPQYQSYGRAYSPEPEYQPAYQSYYGRAQSPEPDDGRSASPEPSASNHGDSGIPAGMTEGEYYASFYNRG